MATLVSEAAAPDRLLAPRARPTMEEMLLHHEIEQFYTLEAWLLDERKFHEWLELLTDDIEYWMPVRSTRTRADMHLEFSRPGEGAFFDDDKALLERRVRKLDTGYSWAEDPPSRTRHLVTNVRLLGEVDGELEVESSFHIYRTRLANDEEWWYGKRSDRLRRGDRGLQVARRHIYLDHVSLNSKNLSIFF